MLLQKIYCLKVLALISLLSFFPMGSHAQNVDGGDPQEQILQLFYPYRQGAPQVEEITPGMTINQNNFQVVKMILPPELLRVVEAGEMEINVQETTDFPVREEYVAATIEHFGQAQLGEGGNLKNYTKGLPFPLLDPADPQVGLKAAWNFRYRDLGDSMQTQGVLDVLHEGTVERSVEARHARRYGMHRLSPDLNVPEWEEEGIWWKEMTMVLRPSDLEGTQLLTAHADADTVAHEKWTYNPQSRRTRKVVHNPLEATFGLNLLTEDHKGFDGYIRDHNWHYQGEQIALVPGFLKGGRPTRGGKNGWYPMMPWELRKVILMEIIPKNADHPYGKRRFYIDQQTLEVLYAFVYDRDGIHWRTLFHCFANPKFDPKNADAGVPLHVGNVWIDYKTNYTTFWIEDEILMNKPVPSNIFTVKELLRRGK